MQAATRPNITDLLYQTTFHPGLNLPVAVWIRNPTDKEVKLNIFVQLAKQTPMGLIGAQQSVFWTIVPYGHTFYTITLELPSNLILGSYNLKAVITDRETGVIYDTETRANAITLIAA